MRFLLTLPLLVALVAAAPFNEEEETTVITKEYYPESLVIYKGDHDIVDIMVPLNSVSDSDSTESEEDLKKQIMVFFIEAENAEDGSRKYKGISVYKNGKTTKIMDGGKAMDASTDDSKYVFFGADDGLYVYNPETQSAEKYGDFDYSIKDIAKENNNDVLYVLTEDREVYKVYDAATKKEKIDDIKDANQIVSDYANNLYYYGDDKKPYVRTANGETFKFEGIPEGKEVKLFRPSLFEGDTAAFLVDNVMFTLNPNGSFKPAYLEFDADAKPTAYSMEAAVIRYFGYQKKIYEYDFLSLVQSGETTSEP